MIKIKTNLAINESEIKISYIASPGPGGQNVNKVATTAQLRFNVLHSASLSEEMRLQILSVLQTKLTNHGELVIKANRFRTQERNKEDAINRLIVMLHHATATPKKRLKTKPTKASVKRRLDAKKAHAVKKSNRRGGGDDDG